jgi:hypothetical protein
LRCKTVIEGEIVEWKAEDTDNKQREAQLRNNRNATGLKVGVWINFGRTKCESWRLVM